MIDGVRFQPASDRSLLVRFGDQITIETHQRIRALLQLLSQEPIAGVRNLNPAYCSVLVHFDGLRWTHSELEQTLGGYIARLGAVPLPEPRHVEIPVYYGDEFGPDLPEVASRHGMTPAQVIGLHTSVTYVVYFLGFVPGFAYLGELPEQLVTPRLARPRRTVPAGSVGIAGRQTGVYPFTVPGGWRIIGRTATKMFREGQATMSLLSIGDRVRFTSVSGPRLAALENA